MKKLITLAATLTYFSINAQTYNYAHKFGNSSVQQCRAVAHDAAGNVYAGGDFAGVIDLDPGPGVVNFTATGGGDAFICKLNSSGNYVWGFSLSSSGGDGITGISIDNSSNVYITGSFGGTTDFDPGVGVTNLTNSGSQDAFVAKYNSAGVFQWAFKIGNTNYDIGYSICNDLAGNVLIAGDFMGTVDFDPAAPVVNFTSPAGDAFLAKYTPAGNYVWALCVGTPTSQSEGWCVATDLSNNVFLSGQFFGTKDFDPSPSVFTLTSNGSRDGYLAKFNASGSFQWALSLGTSNSDYASCVKIDNSGNAFLSGSFDGTVDFDPSVGTFTLSSFGMDDIFLAKYNSSGNFIFANKIGGTNVDFARAIDIDGSDNAFLTGYFRGTADFDPSPSTATITSAGFNDMFVAKYNSSGLYQYAFSAGSSGFEEGTDISVNSAGNFYVGGSFENTVDFNPGIGVNNLTSSGNLDAYIAKYADCLSQPSSPGSITGSVSICNGGVSASYSVAAITGANSYNWSLPGGWSGTSTTNVISTTVGLSGGNLSVTAVNACGTSSAQVITVTVNPSPTITVNNGSICAGSNFTMSPSGANTYTFQGGNAVVSPTSTSSYTIVGTNTLGCNSNIVTSNITVNPLPTVNAVSTTSLLCVGQSATLTASGASTYTWNPGGAGTSIVVSPTTNATYSLVGIDVNGCQNITSFTQSVSACTGIDPVAVALEATIEVYPNPTNDILNIELFSLIENSRIEISNTLGQIVLTEKITSDHLSLTTNHLCRGIYFVKLKNGNTIVTKKIILE